MKNLLIIISLLSLSVSCTKKEQKPPEQAQQQPPAEQAAQPVVTELTKQILKEGTGNLAENGMIAKVHYTGTFMDGRKFDSSLDRGQPFEFLVGAGQVIKGWDIGVAGMKVGEKIKLTVPPGMAYGEAGVGPIPPNTPLLFEIELLDLIKPQAAEPAKKTGAKKEEPKK